jgi:hypothetical protein
MFLPWPGLFEQIRLADVFVHYDDVQLPHGRSFMSRVQIKTANGVKWLSAPLDRKHSGGCINETLLTADERWRARHLDTLRHSCARAPFVREMLDLAESIYAFPTRNLAQFNMRAIETIAEWFGLETRFHTSSELGIEGRSSQRLIDICNHFDASEYITGHGARNYLDHEAFEAAGVKVSYMQYQCRPYPQLHGPFTPYVSALDLAANCGRGGAKYICSGTMDWKDFLNESD